MPSFPVLCPQQCYLASSAEQKIKFKLHGARNKPLGIDDLVIFIKAQRWLELRCFALHFTGLIGVC